MTCWWWCWKNILKRKKMYFFFFFFVSIFFQNSVRQTVWSSPNTYTYNFRKKILKLVNKRNYFFGDFLIFLKNKDWWITIVMVIWLYRGGWSRFNFGFFFSKIFFLNFVRKKLKKVIGVIFQQIHGGFTCFLLILSFLSWILTSQI